MKDSATVIILASKSIGRKKLLKMLKMPFVIIPSKIKEREILGENPAETLKLRARKKGENVFENINKYLKTIKPDKKTKRFLILSADSGAIFNNKLIGKPKDYKEAVKILKMLSGKTHAYITAIYAILIDQNISGDLQKKREWNIEEKSRVTFRKLSDESIRLHLSLSNYTKYAAGYALFASSQDFIAKVEGSLSNIIGFPLDKIIKILKEAGGVVHYPA